MPSPMIGGASPAALPIRNGASDRSVRIPGSIGPAASHGPSSDAPVSAARTPPHSRDTNASIASPAPRRRPR